MKMWKWQLRLCNMNYCLFISVTGAWTKALSTPTSKWRIAQWTTRTWSFPTARTVGRRVNCGGLHQIHFGRIEKHSMLMYHLQDSEGGGCIKIWNRVKPPTWRISTSDISVFTWGQSIVYFLKVRNLEDIVWTSMLVFREKRNTLCF